MCVTSLGDTVEAIVLLVTDEAQSLRSRLMAVDVWRSARISAVSNNDKMSVCISWGSEMNRSPSLLLSSLDVVATVD